MLIRASEKANWISSHVSFYIPNLYPPSSLLVIVMEEHQAPNLSLVRLPTQMPTYTPMPKVSVI